MEILGVGLPEIAFIVLIALILLGPKDMIAAGRTFGSTLRKFLTSPTWQAMRKTGEELQQLPTKLVREAGLEDVQKELSSVSNQIKPSEFTKTFNESQVFAPNRWGVTLEKPSSPLPPSAVDPAPKSTLIEPGQETESTDEQKS